MASFGTRRGMFGAMLIFAAGVGLIGLGTDVWGSFPVVIIGLALFGFGNDSDAGTSAACGHYWECSRNQSRYFGGKSGYHDWHAQWRVLSDWVATGVVSYFERRPATLKAP